MAGYYENQSLLAGQGRIAAPQLRSVGDDVIRGGQLVAEALKSGRQREMENAKFAAEMEANKRSKELFDRQTTEYNREVAGRQALQDYASNPIDTTRMLESQRALADEAFVKDAEARNAKWDASLKANNITQEQVNKGLVGKDVLDRLYDPAYDEKIINSINKVYESTTPFREDVETTIFRDLVAKNVDPLKAKEYASREASRFQSIPEYQANLTAQAEKKTLAEKERFKDLMDTANFNLNVDNANRKAWQDEQELVLKKLALYGGGTGTSSGASGVGLGKGPDVKVLSDINTKTGNPDKTISAYTNAVTTFGPRVAAAALAMEIDKPVNWYDPFEAGKRDIDIPKFEENVKKLASTMPSYQGMLDTAASSKPERSVYTLGAPATVYSPESARAVAQGGMKDRLMQAIGDGTNTAVTSAVSKPGEGNTVASEMPTSLKKMEGTKATAYDDGKGNITIGTGYNMSSKSNAEIARDFKASGIDPNDINDIKAGKKSLTPAQIKGLESVSYATDGPNKLKKIGIDVESLNPALAEIGVSQAFRGDVVKNGEGYRGRLYEHLKNNDLNGMVKDVTTSSDIPKEVKQRLKLVPGIGTAGAEGPKTEVQYKNELKPVDYRTTENIAAPVLTPEEPKKLETGLQFIGRTLAEGTKDTYNQAKGAVSLARDVVMPAVEGVFGKTDDKKLQAGADLIKNSAGGMVEIAGSPYTAAKRFTDWLVYGESQGDSVFQKIATNTRDQAVQSLKEAGVTDPSDQQVAMFVSDALMPGGAGVAKSTKLLKNTGVVDRLTSLLTPTAKEPFKIDLGEVAPIVDKSILGTGKRASVNTDAGVVDGINDRLLKNLNVSSMKNRTDAKMFWNGVVDARAKGQLSEEQVMETMRKLNDSGLISTRELMEALDKVGAVK